MRFGSCFSMSVLMLALIDSFSLGMTQPQLTFQHSSNINRTAMLQELFDLSKKILLKPSSLRSRRRADKDGNILPDNRGRIKRIFEPVSDADIKHSFITIGSRPTEAKNEVTSPPDQLKEVTLRNDVTTDNEEGTDEMALAETKIVNISENISKENTTPSETTDTTTPSELKDTTAPSESIDTTNISESTGSETTEINTEITATDETPRNEQSKVPGKTGSFTVANERTEIASSSETEDVSTTIVQETSESATTAPAEHTNSGQQPKPKSKKTKRQPSRKKRLNKMRGHFDKSSDNGATGTDQQLEKYGYYADDNEDLNVAEGLAGGLRIRRDIEDKHLCPMDEEDTKLHEKKLAEEAKKTKNEGNKERT